ncbi:MAG: nitrite reductase (NAD(P)H) small subunit [Deltaproteobacteria bacterium]
MLVNDRQIALFLLQDGSLHALDNHEPISGANVLSRGIVGDRAGVPVVASPEAAVGR